jgi:hypothetical protein
LVEPNRHGFDPLSFPRRKAPSGCTEARRTEEAKRHGYKSARWQKVRRQRLELAGHVCELKLGGCTIRATHVHLPAGVHLDRSSTASYAYLSDLGSTLIVRVH